MSHQELVSGILRNDPYTLRYFVDTFQDRIFRTCFGIVQHREDAQDLTQDVFVEVFRSIGTFRQDSLLSTWLYRISINKSLNHIRYKKRRNWLTGFESHNGSEKHVLVEVEDPDQSRPDEIVEKEEASAMLSRAIDSLPHQQRVAFTYHKYEDMSYKDIAETMQISLPAVESLIFRAKRSIIRKMTRIYQN